MIHLAQDNSHLFYYENITYKKHKTQINILSILF